VAKIPFLDRIKKGDVLVSDGAMGTNLQMRGLEIGEPAEAMLFVEPEKNLRLHKEFIDAGANIILTNTFGASEIRLKVSDFDDHSVETVNEKAVEIAREAIGSRDIYLAGSIGPCGGLLKPYGELDEDIVFESYAQQSSVLNASRVDLLVIETQFDLNEALVAIKAARSVSDLPLVCSFSFDRGTRTMMGVTPKQVINALNKDEVNHFQITMLGINCGRSLDENLICLQEMSSLTSLPIWFKPNAGLPTTDDKGKSYYDLAPSMMGAHAEKWIINGAQIVGGCCGTTPQHLYDISQHILNL
jgi:5-methyltetrahydrofolate--homocysteine methyltransferase